MKERSVLLGKTCVVTRLSRTLLFSLTTPWMVRLPIWQVKSTTLTPSYRGKSYLDSLMASLESLTKVCESTVRDVVDRIEEYVDSFTSGNRFSTGRTTSFTSKYTSPQAHHIITATQMIVVERILLQQFRLTIHVLTQRKHLWRGKKRKYEKAGSLL